MKIIEKTLNLKNTYDLSRHFAGKNPIFIDIETTGLSPERSHTYLIGCIHPLEAGRWHFIQWLAESPLEERRILEAAVSYVKDFSPLVHFNGDRFDLPYLQFRCEEKGIESDFTARESFDLYKQIKLCRNLCALPNCKQKTIEYFLGIGREDQYDGGRLIPVYHQYVKEGGDDLLHLLLIHNEEDVIGMTRLLPMLEYVDLLNGSTAILSGLPEIISDSEAEGELLLSFPLLHTYPAQASFRKDGWYGIIRRNNLRLRIPVLSGELRYYFPNPKDYYYLPEEDMAVHKSVAEYVDKAYREKATAENCYIRKQGAFIPYPETDAPGGRKTRSHLNRACSDTDHKPGIFRNSPREQAYCEWTDEQRNNICFWETYLHSLMTYLQ